jgi:hypothetical protein
MVIEVLTSWGEAVMSPAATEAELRSCEVALGHSLPEELRALLGESDGVVGEYGMGLVWPQRRIADDNRRFREDDEFARLYMPFESLLFFADAGNGDQFAISLRGSQDVFVWNHEDDSRTWVATTVLQYLEEWMTDRLAV